MRTGEGRIFVLALCGGADRPISGLGGATPFEAAVTPAMDDLARRGSTGLLEVISGNIPPESDSGAMALLGYDPMVHYTGRGPLEAFGAGFWDPAGHSASFRINFASFNRETGRLDRRTARDLSDDELAQLVHEIREKTDLGPDITMHLTGWGRHRGILAFTSRRLPLSGDVSNTDPGFVKDGPFGVPVPDHDGVPADCHAQTDDEAAHRVAALVNSFVAQSAEVLVASEVNARRAECGRKPANLLLVRDGGHTLPELPPATMRISMYGQVPAEHGLARLIGARFTTAKPRPDQSDSAFYRWLLPHLSEDQSDIVFAHIKGPDEPGHDGQPEAKVAAITALDGALVGPLRDALRPSDTLVVTCDHATPCELGIHSTDRVPIAVAGPGVAADHVHAFSEKATACGRLPVTRANELMPWLLRHRGAAG